METKQALELKHLNPYPTGLILQQDMEQWHPSHFKEGETRVKDVVYKGFIESEYPSVFYDFIDKKGGGNDYINAFKPYLRPLSQLTQEIEHGGKIVNVLGDKLGLFQESVVGNKIVDFRNGIEIPFEHLEYRRVEILLKYHFDVFGLIEKGLAIEKK